MPPCLPSLLDLKSVSLEQIELLFSFASMLKRRRLVPTNRGLTAALAFFEPSTRTRLSFETASIRAGLGPLVFEGGSNTSLEKGETIEDSILNIAAMLPSVLIVRCGNEVDLAGISKKVSVPVINAGWGTKGHPTQALLDLFTLREKWTSLSGKKLLIVGDLKHSRVASSHAEIFAKTGMQIGQCAHPDFALPSPEIVFFSQLSEGLQWADAVMALRFQFERHDKSLGFSKEDYRSRYGLNRNSLQALKADGFILHPGPVHYGVEMEAEVSGDPRAVVLEQVTNGVFLREALLRTVLGEPA